MAGKHQYDWPSLEQILEVLERHDSYETAAKELVGASGNALRHYIRNYHGDEARKLCAAALRKGRTKRRNRVEEVLLVDPEAGVSQEELLRQRNDELETALRKKRKADVFEERLLVALSEAITARKPRYQPKPLKPSAGRSGHEMALLWSDLHYPEVVSAEETNGINEYDPTIMWRRHDVLRERLASHLDQRKDKPSVLHVWALGDMLSGNIHEELAETNDLPLAEATMQFAEDGATWLESLLELGFQRIRFTGVFGNHPRLHQKPRAKQGFDNFDWVAYHGMRLTLAKNEAVSFDIPKGGMHPVIVCKRWRVLLWHGDGVRTTMPGVPWGGIVRRAVALQNEYTSAGLPLDYFAVGHWHQGNDVQVGTARAYMNGSVKGPDEYSLKAFGGGAAAQQLLLNFHPKHGCVGTAYLDLDRAGRQPHLKAVA